MRWLRLIARIFLFLLGWALLVRLTGAPPYILPSPWAVLAEIRLSAGLLAWHGFVTLSEIVAGFVLGALLGIASALIMLRFTLARRFLLPAMVVTQAIPVFALAPLLTLWLGYGIGSKIAMTTLMIYFPVMAALHDGLRRTPPPLLDLAALSGARPFRALVHIRFPAALPALATGLKMAAVFAPIGAVVGEWVGASDGLGHLMLYASGRVKIDLMFAALFLLVLLTLGLHALVARATQRMTHWMPERDLQDSTVMERNASL